MQPTFLLTFLHKSLSDQHQTNMMEGIYLEEVEKEREEKRQKSSLWEYWDVSLNENVWINMYRHQCRFLTLVMYIYIWTRKTECSMEHSDTLILTFISILLIDFLLCMGIGGRSVHVAVHVKRKIKKDLLFLSRWLWPFPNYQIHSHQTGHSISATVFLLPCILTVYENDLIHFWALMVIWNG